MSQNNQVCPKCGKNEGNLNCSICHGQNTKNVKDRLPRQRSTEIKFMTVEETLNEKFNPATDLFTPDLF